MIFFIIAAMIIGAFFIWGRNQVKPLILKLSDTVQTSETEPMITIKHNKTEWDENNGLATFFLDRKFYFKHDQYKKWQAPCGCWRDESTKMGEWCCQEHTIEDRAKYILLREQQNARQQWEDQQRDKHQKEIQAKIRARAEELRAAQQIGEKQ